MKSLAKVLVEISSHYVGLKPGIEYCCSRERENEMQKPTEREEKNKWKGGRKRRETESKRGRDQEIKKE